MHHVRPQQPKRALLRLLRKFRRDTCVMCVSIIRVKSRARVGCMYILTNCCSLKLSPQPVQASRKRPGLISRVMGGRLALSQASAVGPGWLGSLSSLPPREEPSLPSQPPLTASWCNVVLR